MPKPVLKSHLESPGCGRVLGGLFFATLGLLTMPTIIGPLVLWPIAAFALFGGSSGFGTPAGTKALGVKNEWHCSECGNVVPGKRVKVCGSCGADFR